MPGNAYAAISRGKQIPEIELYVDAVAQLLEGKR